ncbi:MAG: succinate dehydrogenase cytochrome b subunit [Acidobacteriota bacterium]
MPAKSGFWNSTIGRKIVMAVTGLILFGFVLAHLVGNLQLYLGPDAINAYGLFLRQVFHGAGLWIARAGLLVAVVLHIWAATSLTLASRAARPVAYRRWQPRESTYASRTMRWGGVIVLLFVIYHLLHFTLGTVHPSFVPGDVYHNMVAGFQVPWVSAFYIIAMLALGLHLRHGLWSMFQTLGVAHPRYERYAKAFAAVFAAVIVLGNISFPISVLAGWVR